MRINTIEAFLSMINGFTNHENCMFYFEIQNILVPINHIYSDPNNDVCITYSENLVKNTLKLKDIIIKLSRYDNHDLLYYKGLLNGIEIKTGLDFYKDACYYNAKKKRIVYKLPV